MSSLDDLRQRLHASAPRPPGPDELRRRSTRRTRRRATAVSLAALVVVVAGIGAVAGSDGHQKAVAVRTAADPTVTTDEPNIPGTSSGSTTSPSADTTSTTAGAIDASTTTGAKSTTTTTARPNTVPTPPRHRAPQPSTGRPSFTLSPSGPLQVDQRVTVHLDPPPAPGAMVSVIQCASEVTDHLSGTDGLPWCSGVIGSSQITVLQAVAQNTGHTVDCAERPGRCVIVVRVGGMDSADTRVVPITVRASAPLVYVTAAVVTPQPPGGFADGAAVVVRAEHIGPGTVFILQQCRTTAGAPGKEDCDQSHGEVLSTEAGADGVATATITVRRTFPTDAVGPVTCGDCRLLVYAGPDSPLLSIRVAG